MKKMRKKVTALRQTQEPCFQEEAMTREPPTEIAERREEDNRCLTALEERMDRLSRQVEEVRRLYGKEEPGSPPARQMTPYIGPSLWDLVYAKIRAWVRAVERFFS